jgi:hypothetical protein
MEFVLKTRTSRHQAFPHYCFPSSRCPQTGVFPSFCTLPDSEIGQIQERVACSMYIPLNPHGIVGHRGDVRTILHLDSAPGCKWRHSLVVYMSVQLVYRGMNHHPQIQVERVKETVGSEPVVCVEQLPVVQSRSLQVLLRASVVVLACRPRCCVCLLCKVGCQGIRRR